MEVSPEITAAAAGNRESGKFPQNSAWIRKALPEEVSPLDEPPRLRQGQIEGISHEAVDSGKPRVPTSEEHLVRQGRRGIEVEPPPGSTPLEPAPRLVVGDANRAEKPLVQQERRGIEVDPPGSALLEPAPRLLVGDPNRVEEPQQPSGPRIHIGTIEIRTVRPKPDQNPETAKPAAQLEARSRPAESLARTLAWGYGSIQG